MSESLQLRTEHSRSLEDATKFKALQDLTELGVLIPLEEIETYHGRVANEQDTKPWTVDRTFANGSNDSGNNNVNNRPTLYTGERQVALDFATARKAHLERTGVPQRLHPAAYRITSPDTEARILDIAFDPMTLPDDKQAMYFKALKGLVIPMTEGSPVDFDDRNHTKSVIKQISLLGTSTLAQEDVATIAAKTGATVATVEQLAGAYNAAHLSHTNLGYMAYRLISSRGAIITDSVPTPNGPVEAPINLEYVERYMRNAGIVGVKQRITSATLGDRRVDSISMFDLEKVNTVAEVEKQRETTWKHLGPLTNIKEVRMEAPMGRPQAPLMKTLEDVYAKPEKLVADARKVPGYDRLFDADAGNWEGYTLGEHTETVLRNIDENYADTMPVQLLKFMRLAAIAHDIGKPNAAAEGDRANQKKYNLSQAADFFTNLGIDPNTQGLLMAMIGEGQEYALQLDVRKGGAAALANMKHFAEKTLQRFTSSGEASDDQTYAFMTICRALQVCDGGAYTSMAVTRKSSGGRHRNAPSFNTAFAPPTGPGKRTIELRKPNQASAPERLAPRRL